MSQNESTDAAIGTSPDVDASGDITDNDLYHGYSVDDETQPQSTGDSLVDDDRGLEEPLDEGFSPPEKYSAGQRWGNTPLEESLGETFDQRLEQEIPEPDPYEQAEREAESGELAENAGEVGDARAGRLVAPDEGAHTDLEADPIAQDVGIDGAAATAEEAAMHVVPDEDL
jgi:hypothetical protein